MIDLTHFTPAASFGGGLLIGGAAGLLVLLDGRIAGISGIVGGLLRPARGDTAWRVAFVLGLIGAALLAAALGRPAVIRIEAGWGSVLVAGFLVGVGTRFASGCTSGHGVCGLSRGARRSLVATLTFMASGCAATFVVRHVLGG